MEIKPSILELFGEGQGLEIYLKLNEEKFVKVCHTDEEYRTVATKYKGRGVEKLFLLQESYKRFVKSVRDSLIKKIEEERLKQSDQSSVSLFPISSAQEVLTTLIREGALDEESKELARAIMSETMGVIKRKTSLAELLKAFKENSAQEYAMALMTSYIASLAIDEFSWAKDEVKEKVIMAAILCDVFMTPNDFKILQQKKNIAKDLPEHIRLHPLKTAERIEGDEKFVSVETLKIIKEHHERPNGKGFPHGVNYSAVSPLSAIYITSTYLCERLFEQINSYGFDSIDETFLNNQLTQLNEKFCSGNYKKASEAISKVFKLN